MFMIDRLTKYHIVCLDSKNSAGAPILTWHLTNSQTSSFSMQIKFEGDTKRGLESALYAGTVIG
jgi:hypothetical protein